MTARRTTAALVSLVALGSAALAATPSFSAAAKGSSAVVITEKLDAPFGLQRSLGHRGFVVAESDTGQVTRVYLDGRKHAILKGVPGVAGVAASPTNVFAVIAGPNQVGPVTGGKFGPSRLLRMDYQGKHVKVLANLLHYERVHNPDGQVQHVNGHPIDDELSNPFAMTWSKYGLFVADGGANDVLRVDPQTGKVNTFFVPPTVKNVPACKGPDASANPGTLGCDPVPTGVQVLGGSVYVSTFGGEVSGAGRIYKLSARTGKVLKVWKGFTEPTGLAVRPDGTIYFSEVWFNLPDVPSANFDWSTVGRITRIRDGHVTHSQVTTPTGLALKKGHLYASAWSIVYFNPVEHRGEIVRVRESSFH